MIRGYEARRRSLRMMLAGLLVWVTAGAVGAAAPASAQDNVLRIAAVVNGDVISVYDLQNRLALVALSSGLTLDQETQRRLLPQVMRGMIDEKLQLQAAGEAGVRVTEREIESAVENLAGRNNMSPEGMRQFLAARGVAESALRAQIEPQIAWTKYVQRRLSRDVRVGEDEVDEELARLVDVADEPQRRVYEIFLTVDNPDRASEVRLNAERLLTQIRGGADFSSIARSFSQSSTAPQGGDLGWVLPGQLEPQLDAVLQQLNPGMVSRPIRTVSGYYLLFVTDERIAGVDPLDARIDLAQMTVRPPQEQDARAAVEAALRQRIPTLGGCADLQALGEGRPDATIARADGVRLGDLPEAVRRAIEPLQPGQTSLPIERNGALIVIGVCDRQEAAANLPGREAIGQRLMAERLDLRAQRELRDLRQAAFVDVRL